MDTWKCGDKGVEFGDLVGLKVNKVEPRRILKQRLADLAANIPLDEDDCNEDRQAKTKRENYARRRCAGPMEICNGDPQTCVSWSR